MAVAKTNAMRILDGLGLAYTVREFEVDGNDVAAETAAAKLGLPPAQVFKTLVARGDRTGVMLAAIPAGTRLDLKALARASGNRSAATVPLKEIQALTGYVRGAVTALGCKKVYRVFLDASAERLPVIGVSGGSRGVEILMAPRDYARAVGAIVAPIATAG
ncbi:MAG TPA: Cys-tRNA(Pro) deacylase [Candidatus Binatia bacterium]|jgi:Cys-tRNA(Pro)/Cys-tRNA(Cys) deacylase|nr:Cys-tRNA(Pro) deacylase [Candidatus Binatia bacterium]